MPTYEYRCPQGHEFEKFFRTISGAPAAVNCPTCGEPAVRQLSGGAGLLFKGSGFYLTDYGKNAHANKGPKPAAAEGKTGDGAASSGDSKSSGEPAAGGAASSSGSGQGSAAGGSGATGGSTPASGGSSGSSTGGGGSTGSTGGSSGKTKE